MVTLRRPDVLNSALRLVQLGLLGVVIVSVYRALARPAPQVPKPVSTRAAEPAVTDVPDSRPLAGYAPIWQRDLRQPPIPPVVQADAPPPETPPPPLPRLLGTFVEPQERWAYFLTLDGHTRTYQTDESVNGYRIVAIEPGRAQLAAAGQVHWVTLPRQPQDEVVK